MCVLIAHAQSDWMESLSEQFSGAATYSHLDLGLDFDRAIITLEYALI